MAFYIFTCQRCGKRLQIEYEFEIERLAKEKLQAEKQAKKLGWTCSISGQWLQIHKWYCPKCSEKEKL